MIPHFDKHLGQISCLLEHMIEVKLDEQLIANDSNFVLLNDRYGLFDAMMIHVTTMFVSAEFKTLLHNILFNFF